jgi:opacity protein-like surface antigen/outer membrane protease
MKTVSVAVFGLVVMIGQAKAADMPQVPFSAPSWSWTGLYLGGHLGAGLGSSQFSDPAGASIYGDNVRTPAVFGGGQVGYNWQIPHSNWLLGAEAEASLLRANGTATCLASSGFFISANCHVVQDASGSFTGRLGFATGPGGRTLLYVKGGVAWLDEQIGITTNALDNYTRFDGLRWGWTAGVGLEKALTPAWSIRLEYDYAHFGDVGVATPSSYLLQGGNYVATPGGTTSASQNLQLVKLGLNLKLNEDMYAKWEPSSSDYRLRGTTDAPYLPDAQIEVGGRTWYSSGRFQKDLGSTATVAQQDVLNSRLTYDTTSVSGEVYGRIDTSSNLFLKGFIGGGAHLSGNMHDEDWLIFNETVPYSNTLSTVKGDLTYATIDFGYALFHGPSSKVGGFIGYNYYRENKSAYGCVQIANPNSDCVPSVPNSTLGITEDDTWNSLRIGVNAELALTNKWTLTADAAYLPLVSFAGIDNHVQRTDVSNTLSPESGRGQGVQLEAILGYAVTKSFNVGAGARYWAMWATDATVNAFSLGCPCQTLPVRTERYGAFVQAAYKLDGL